MADRGQALIDSHKPIPFRLSAGCFERALSIANALANAAKSRGFKIHDDHEKRRLVFSGHNAAIPWRLNEKFEQHIRTRIAYNGTKEPESYFAPTGILKLTLETSSGSTVTFIDEPGEPLEKQTLKILAGLYKCVIRQHVRDREEADRRRRWDEDAREHVRVETERRAEAMRVEQERARRDKLIAASKRWREARILREYVAYRQERAKAGATDNTLAEWVLWANSVADDLDSSGTTVL